MEPAIRKQYRLEHPSLKMDPGSQAQREVPDWETRLGKAIFYITCATAIWFFYWLNGIQCPC
ncbi:hypothetical protein [Candidatus Nitrospira bockiana]